MKKIFVLLAISGIIINSAIAQNSGLGFNYQAVIRNAYGFVIQDSAVTLKVGLYPGQQAQTPTWVEMHNVQTDKFGTIGIRVGHGVRDNASVAAQFSDVNFAAVYYWLKIEINEAGTYKEISFTSLPSCPYCEVANNASVVPAGMVMAFAGDITKIPNGWMLCDGRQLDRSQYANLYNVIGVAWGTGNNSTTFNIPDMRGYFLRGVDNRPSGSQVDGNRSTRTPLQPGGNSGAMVGSYQQDAAPNITGQFGNAENGQANGAFTRTASGNYVLGGSGTGAYFNFNASLSNSTYGRENTIEIRPKNVYVNYIIKL